MAGGGGGGGGGDNDFDASELYTIRAAQSLFRAKMQARVLEALREHARVAFAVRLFEDLVLRRAFATWMERAVVLFHKRAQLHKAAVFFRSLLLDELFRRWMRYPAHRAHRRQEAHIAAAFHERVVAKRGLRAWAENARAGSRKRERGAEARHHFSRHLMRAGFGGFATALRRARSARMATSRADEFFRDLRLRAALVAWGARATEGRRQNELTAQARDFRAFLLKVAAFSALRRYHAEAVYIRTYMDVAERHHAALLTRRTLAALTALAVEAAAGVARAKAFWWCRAAHSGLHAFVVSVAAGQGAVAAAGELQREFRRRLARKCLGELAAHAVRCCSRRDMLARALQHRRRRLAAWALGGFCKEAQDFREDAAKGVQARAHWSSRLAREAFRAWARLFRAEDARREDLRLRVLSCLAGSCLLWGFKRWAAAWVMSRASAVASLQALLHRDARLLRKAFCGSWAAPLRARAAERVASLLRCWLDASQASLRLSCVHYSVWLLRRSVQAWGVGLLDRRLEQSKKTLAQVHRRHQSLRATAREWRNAAGAAFRRRCLLTAFCRWRFGCSPEVTRAVLQRRAFPAVSSAPAAETDAIEGVSDHSPALSAELRGRLRAALPKSGLLLRREDWPWGGAEGGEGGGGGRGPGGAGVGLSAGLLLDARFTRLAALGTELSQLSNAACAEVQRRAGRPGAEMEAAAELLESVSEAALSFVQCAGLVSARRQAHALDGKLACFSGWKLALRCGRVHRAVADAAAPSVVPIQN